MIAVTEFLHCIEAIDAAEAEALRQHQAGTCHLSEWSCSWCSTDEDDA